MHGHISTLFDDQWTPFNAVSPRGATHWLRPEHTRFARVCVSYCHIHGGSYAGEVLPFNNVTPVSRFLSTAWRVLISFCPVPDAKFICMLRTKDSQFNVALAPLHSSSQDPKPASPTFVKLSIPHVCPDHHRNLSMHVTFHSRSWHELFGRKKPDR